MSQSQSRARSSSVGPADRDVKLAISDEEPYMEAVLEKCCSLLVEMKDQIDAKEAQLKKQRDDTLQRRKTSKTRAIKRETHIKDLQEETSRLQNELDESQAESERLCTESQRHIVHLQTLLSDAESKLAHYMERTKLAMKTIKGKDREVRSTRADNKVLSSDVIGSFQNMVVRMDKQLAAYMPEHRNFNASAAYIDKLQDRVKELNHAVTERNEHIEKLNEQLETCAKLYDEAQRAVLEQEDYPAMNELLSRMRAMLGSPVTPAWEMKLHKCA